MQVRVLYFGVLKERSNVAEETVELSGSATVGELVRVLRERSSKTPMASGLENVWQGLAVAVNREYASADAMLCDGDEVALLPPVSGGRFEYRDFAPQPTVRPSAGRFDECDWYPGGTLIVRQTRAKCLRARNWMDSIGALRWLTGSRRRKGAKGARN